MFNISPKQMEKMMKQMGLSNETVEAEEVIIKRPSGDLIIKNPSVTKMTMQGQVSYQITGDTEESSFSEDDVKLIMEQTGKPREEAEAALKETGDIAEAIMKLSG